MSQSNIETKDLDQIRFIVIASRASLCVAILSFLIAKRLSDGAP